MVIGDKGERIKRIGTETRQELEKLMDAKVFLELWVKVRSGWADDEAAGAQLRLRVAAGQPRCSRRAASQSRPTCCTATTGASRA